MSKVKRLSLCGVYVYCWDESEFYRQGGRKYAKENAEDMEGDFPASVGIFGKLEDAEGKQPACFYTRILYPGFSDRVFRKSPENLKILKI